MFAAVWIALGRRGKDLSAPAKFAVGLSLAFCIMYIASQHVVTAGEIAPYLLTA